MTEMATEYDFLALIEESLEIPCDYSERDWCCKAEARWVLYMTCGACSHSQARLAGTACKDLFLNTYDVVECPVCGEFGTPREFLRYVEAL